MGRITKEADLYSGKKITQAPVYEAAGSAHNLESLSKEEAEGFFSNLVEAAPQRKEVPRSRGSSLAEMGAMEHISRNMNWNEGVEKIIKQSILIGNLEGAVDCCLKCGRAVLLVSIPL